MSWTDYKEVVQGIVNQRRYEIEFPGMQNVEKTVTDHYGAKCNRVFRLSSVSPAFKEAQVKHYIDEATKEVKALDAIRVKGKEEQVHATLNRTPPLRSYIPVTVGGLGGGGAVDPNRPPHQHSMSISDLQSLIFNGDNKNEGDKT